MSSVGAADGKTKPRNVAEESYWNYTRWAKKSRRLYHVNEVMVLTVAALVPVSAVLTDEQAIPAVLGAVIVILTGVRKIFNWHDDWIRFTAACSALRMEDAKFEHRLPPYHESNAVGLLAQHVREIEQAETQNWMVLRRAATESDSETHAAVT